MFELKRHDRPVKVLGLMSGTSGDGIDGCLVEFSTAGDQRLLWLKSFAYSEAQFLRIQSLMRNADAVSITLGASYIAELHALACQQFFAKESLLPDAIAAHGQTIWHQPGPQSWDGIALTGTLQLLNGALLAKRCGLPVICNFRAADMAAGGQGAPLVPFADLYLFGRKTGRDLVVVNVGGMANLTAISVSGAQPKVACAFDTGPGNVLMDAYMQHCGAGRFDADGRLAAAGHTLPAQLRELLADPYFQLPPPKSTGREYFNRQRLAPFISDKSLYKAADVMSTLLDLTVISIADAIINLDGQLNFPAEVLVAGGGALNSELMRRLVLQLGERCTLTTTDKYGVPVMAREAMAFAILGYAFLTGTPANVPVATGADTPALLGEYHPAQARFI